MSGVLRGAFGVSASFSSTPNAIPTAIRLRIPIEVGSCPIEVKRDLSAGSVLPDAIEH
jgi:hypothetical protein